MKVITVSNIKGGVAKTTTAATLASGLHKRGKNILLIDADPQTNLTMCFVDIKEEDDEETEETDPSGTEMTEQAKADGSKKGRVVEELPTLYDVFASGKKIDEVRQVIKPGLNIVIGDFTLCSADMQFLYKVGCLKYLTNALKAVTEDYDYVIIDTPPTLGFLTTNAFMASDYVLTPMAADSFSTKAVKLLKQTIDEVSGDRDRKLPVIGTLLTRYTARTNISKAMERSVTKSAALLETKVFSSRIRQASVVMESQLLKMDLFEYAPKAPVTIDYKAFIDEFLERMEG